MRILDCHLHLIYPDRFDYPWLAGGHPLLKEWSAEAYFAEGAALGIEQALHMEVDVAESDILAETAHMLQVHPRVTGAIANCRPESPDFPAQVEALLALGKVHALRRLLQNNPPELSAQPLFRENLRRLPGYGLAFDICVKSHELEIAKALIPACPDVQFVLDHCGNPKIAEGEWDSWAVPLRAIAQNPNIVCKVSGILSNVDDSWTVAQLRPYVEYVIETFGWDRVIWASDHPVVTLFASLTRWVNATKEIVAGASVDEKSKLFHRNGERIYGVERL